MMEPEVPLATPDTEDPIQLLLRDDVGGAYDAVARSAARAVGASHCDLALYDTETASPIILDTPAAQGQGS